MGELPSSRDGLTRVQRAILQSPARTRTVRSNRLLDAILGGIAPSLESKLTARAPAEGDPHLEAYLALAELVQPFRTRYPLFVGHGNFGTIDGDPPSDAAFTRCRVSPFGAEVARGVAPHLIVNGASGRSDDGPFRFLPHNLGEVLSAVTALVRDPRLSDDELASLVPGPDFPTGGVVLSTPVRAIYDAGAGDLVVRGKAHIVTAGGRPAIVVTELPCSVWKSSIAKEVSQGIRDGLLPAIADQLDESDQGGLRMVFPLRSGAEPEKALADLFARTSLQTRLQVNMLALVDGAPRRVSLPTLLRAYARELATALAALEQRDPTAERLLNELEGLRAKHDDARRTKLA